MDAKQAELEEKLAGILKQAADVASQIQAIEQGPGTPHYDQIEIPAHEVGQRLSRMVQASRTGEVAAEQRTECDCPECGLSCPVEVSKREVQSMDGPVELIETAAHCHQCRRSFFPSA
jgi:hypothetical protein